MQINFEIINQLKAKLLSILKKILLAIKGLLDKKALSRYKTI